MVETFPLVQPDLLIVCPKPSNQTIGGQLLISNDHKIPVNAFMTLGSCCTLDIGTKEHYINDQTDVYWIALSKSHIALDKNVQVHSAVEPVPWMNLPPLRAQMANDGTTGVTRNDGVLGPLLSKIVRRPHASWMP